MKKVLIVNTKYKIFGGEDANISDEINLLKKQYNIELLEFDNSQRINIIDLIGFVTNSNRNANKKLTKSLNEFKPDAVYVHNTWFKGNLGIFKILRDKEIPIIHKLHNFRYDCSRHYLASNHYRNVGNCNACYFDKSHKLFNKYYKDSYLKSFFLIRYSKKLFKIFSNYPIKLLVISQFHKNYLVTLGIPSQKIEVYLNPINISDQKNDLKKSNYVVYAGRLNTEKGIENLLDCWSEAKPNNIALKVIGSGDIEERLKEKYKNDSILFLGNLSNQDAKLEISKARAVITATKMYEGQPRLLCEASSFGVPSIYPSFGGMDEFFPSAYEFSFNQYDYKDLKDKIKKINNDELLSKTGIAVKKHMSKILHPEVQLASFDSYLLDR
jgi:glycosyltransferase involved in cell wall biosynthesis